MKPNCTPAAVTHMSKEQTESPKAAAHDMVEQCADLRKSIAAMALTFNSCSSSAAAIWETARAAGGLPGQQQCPPASVAFVRCFHEFHQSLPLLQATNAGLTNRKAQARFPFEPVFGLSFEICRVSVSGSCRSTFAVRQTRHSPCGRRAQSLHRHPAKGGGSSLVRRIDVIVALSSASLRPVVYRRSLVTL